MLEFADFLQKAKELPNIWARRYSKQQGCVGFFSVIVPPKGVWEDILTINSVVHSLEHGQEDELLNYFKKISDCKDDHLKHFIEFKRRVLFGIYLLMWSHYNNPVSDYLNKQLIELFQEDLEINSPSALEPLLYESCLSALSQYCSFIYHHRYEQKIYENLNSRLGDSIQVDIHVLRQSQSIFDFSWQETFTGLIGSFSLN